MLRAIIIIALNLDLNHRSHSDKSDQASVVVLEEYHADHKPDPVFAPSRVIGVHGPVVMMDGTSDQADSDELDLHLKILTKDPLQVNAPKCAPPQLTPPRGRS